METEIPADADLNEYQTAGNYGCSVADNVAGINNKPSGLANQFLLFVHTAGSAVLQEVIDAVDGSRWCRAGAGVWVQTYDSSSIMPIANGGTGMTSNPSMLVNLGSTSAANVLKSSPRPGVTGTLPISRGGTGATSASGAIDALGAASIGNDATSGVVWADLTFGQLVAVTAGTATTRTAAIFSAERMSLYDFVNQKSLNALYFSKELWHGTASFGATISGLSPSELSNYKIARVVTGYGSSFAVPCAVYGGSSGIRCYGVAANIFDDENGFALIVVNLRESGSSMVGYARSIEIYPGSVVMNQINQSITRIFGVV